MQISAIRPYTPIAPSRPPASPQTTSVRDSLPLLSRACLTVGDGMARLGGGGCALVGAGLGAAAMTLLPSLGLPLVGAFLGWASGADAADARQAFEGGPGSAAWQRRDRSALGGPPRSKTTADAGAHLLTAGAFVGGTAAGALLLGTSGPWGLVVGVGAALVSAVATGRAAGIAERALLQERYPGAAG